MRERKLDMACGTPYKKAEKQSTLRCVVSLYATKKERLGNKKAPQSGLKITSQQ